MRLVVITWEDTFADVGWSDKELNPVGIASVGWLIDEDDSKVVLAGMIGTGGLEDFNCRQAIPKGCIKKITTIEEAP